jgi:hypothetical protein
MLNRNLGAAIICLAILVGLFAGVVIFVVAVLNIVIGVIK